MGAVVALAFAPGADDVAGGEEGHLVFDVAVATGFAATAFGVEGESAGGVVAHFGSGEVGEKCPAGQSDPGCGGGRNMTAIA